MRHEGPLLRSYAVTHGPGPVRFPQDPAWHQFVHATSGVVRIDTATGSWTLPPARALWVQAGIDHTAVVVRRAAMRTLYLPAEGGTALLDDDIAVVEMTPLVGSVVAHLVAAAPVPLDDVGRAWVTVLGDRVRALDVSPVQLPAVTSSPAAQVAALLRADPARTDSVDALAALVGSSRRSVERAFAADVGLSVGAWRRRLRLVHALDLLAAGMPVGRVATAVGYATQSAFGEMFRSHFGVAPGRYFRSDEPVSAGDVRAR